MTISLMGATVGEVKLSKIPCVTAGDCWLDVAGNPIKRPASKKGRKIPSGDCGKKLVWLRNVVTCQEKVCAVKFVGDMC